MDDMVSNPSELQLIFMVIYEEVLYHVGTLNCWKGIGYFRGF